jgi:F-box/TPR repeat protein Pof3
VSDLLLTIQGYLRCAKVLLLEGKPDKALEIYAYGLKVLPSKHPRREVSYRCPVILILY